MAPFPLMDGSAGMGGGGMMGVPDFGMFAAKPRGPGGPGVMPAGMCGARGRLAVTRGARRAGVCVCVGGVTCAPTGTHT